MSGRRALVALLLVLAACGRKGSIVAPELVQPEGPTRLVAASVPEGIRLTWNRPDRYTSGRGMKDLGGFIIRRASGEGEAGAFVAVGKVELDDQLRFRKERRIEWIDRDVSPGARYLYTVTAMTTDGYYSAPAGPVIARFEPRSP